MLYSVRKSLIAAGFLTALAIIPPVQAVSPDELFEVLQRIESLENEIRFLRGENEQLRYDIEDVKNTQKSTFIRIDDRMDDLFRAVNSSTSRMSAPVTPELSVPLTKSLPLVDASKPDVVLPAMVSELKAVPSVSDTQSPLMLISLDQKSTQGVESREQLAFDAALAKVDTQPAAAIAQFRGFIKEYPKSPLAANAQYWLGEMMFSSRDYQGAIDEFVVVLQDYGTSQQAPDAAIKLGFSFYEMKNWVYARRTLEDVTRNYPKTAAANLAQAQLDKMKTDNLY